MTRSCLRDAHNGIDIFLPSAGISCVWKFWVLVANEDFIKITVLFFHGMHVRLLLHPNSK